MACVYIPMHCTALAIVRVSTHCCRRISSTVLSLRTTPCGFEWRRRPVAVAVAVGAVVVSVSGAVGAGPGGFGPEVVAASTSAIVSAAVPVVVVAAPPTCCGLVAGMLLLGTVGVGCVAVGSASTWPAGTHTRIGRCCAAAVVSEEQTKTTVPLPAPVPALPVLQSAPPPSLSVPLYVAHNLCGPVVCGQGSLLYTSCACCVGAAFCAAPASACVGVGVFLIPGSVGVLPTFGRGVPALPFPLLVPLSVPFSLPLPLPLPLPSSPWLPPSFEAAQDRLEAACTSARAHTTMKVPPAVKAWVIVPVCRF